jgi:rubrerythrin
MDAETAGLEFYAGVLAATDDPEIKVLAKEFVQEESEHVAELKRWIQLHLSGAKPPTAG